jgi:hypothetical protein
MADGRQLKEHGEWYDENTQFQIKIHHLVHTLR